MYKIFLGQRWGRAWKAFKIKVLREADALRIHLCPSRKTQIEPLAGIWVSLFYTRIQYRFKSVSLSIRNAFCFALNQYLPLWNRVKNGGVLKTTWCKTAVCDGCFLNAKKTTPWLRNAARAYSQGVVVYSLIKSGKQCKQKRIEVGWLFPLRALFWKDYREERNLFIFTPSCCSSCLRRGDVIKLFISPWKMYDGIKSDRYCDLRNRITCGKQ